MAQCLTLLTRRLVYGRLQVMFIEIMWIISGALIGYSVGVISLNYKDIPPKKDRDEENTLN